jgi:hypothetical protein
LGADSLVEAGNGFGVVVEDFGVGLQDDGESCPVAAHIGDEDFDRGFGGDGADGCDAFDELAGSAVGEVVAVDGGDDDVVEVEAADGFGEAIGFGGVERLGLFLEVDVAVGAGAGAGGSHDQEGGGANAEAFADVGAGCFFADGVECQVTEDFGDAADALPLGCFDPEPFWFDCHLLWGGLGMGLIFYQDLGVDSFWAVLPILSLGCSMKILCRFPLIRCPIE